MDAVNDTSRTKRISKVRRNWREGKMKKLEHDLESLWDWICSNIGFDKRGKEIIGAVKLHTKMYVKEAASEEKLKKIITDYISSCIAPVSPSVKGLAKVISKEIK